MEAYDRQKWLNSLHVKSFFEYLMSISNDYWTNIPNDVDPTSQVMRDGVALEDDMALRALIPHIRPKRGRKRPDDMESTPTAQRMRLSPSSATDAVAQSTMVPWARPGDPHLSAHLGFPRSAHPSSGLGPNDGTEGPFSQWPNSAVTPTMRGSFWDDALEPQSAITPTQGKLGRQRRGAKNVSSAWKPGGLDGSGKTRGRPPINRTPIEGPANPWNQPHTATRFNPNLSTPIEQTPNQSPAVPVNPSPLQWHGSSAPVAAPTKVSAPPPPIRTTSAPTIAPGPPTPRTAANNRPGRPSISLQVPERAGGPVRLATPPPPVVMVNGLATADETTNAAPPDGGLSDRWNDIAKETASLYECTDSLPTDQSLPGSVHDTLYFFEKIEDRTNVDSLLSYFVQQVQESQWFDENGNADETAGMDESAAIVNATLENMLKTSTSSQAFLINLAALAGAKTLLASSGRCFRLRDDKDFYHYRFEWEYRFGHFRGQFNMAQSVPRSMWDKPTKDSKTGGEDADAGGADGLSAEDWQRKYAMLLGEMKLRDREISELRAKMWASMQGERG